MRRDRRFVQMAVVAAVLMGAAGVAQELGPVTATARSCPTREVHRIAGWTHRCGTSFVDSRGHLVRPLSVSMFSMAHDTGRDPSACRPSEVPAADTYANYENWGFNTVLLYVSWANIEPSKPTTVNGRLRHHYSKAYLAAVDGVVRQFAKHGVKVILAMANDRWSSAFTHLTLPNGIHVACGSGAPAWLYSSHWIASHGGGLKAMVAAEKRFFASAKLQGWFARAWSKVAKPYSRTKTVIGAVILHEAYDILANPYPGTRGLRPRALNLARFYGRVGKIIHRADRHLLIFTPDQRNWDTNKFALTRKPKVPNAVYDFEFFAPNWKRSGRPRMDIYWHRAMAWRWPAWIEEFYAFLPTVVSSQPRPTWDDNSLLFFQYAQVRHIGWTYSPYSRLPDDPPTLLKTLKKGY